MNSFDQKRTNWEGLWYDNLSHSYKSSAINLSKLKEFKGTVRIIARKNKYYEEGANKPNMVFMIADAEATGKDLEINNMLKGYIKVETAIEIAQHAVDMAIYGESPDDLCVEIQEDMYDNAE
jgi:hypothetical protein